MSFKFIHLTRLAELEYKLRLVEIDLMEHLETCDSPEKNLITEVLTAKVNLARWKVTHYRNSHIL